MSVEHTSGPLPCPFCGAAGEDNKLWPSHFGCSDSDCGGWAANLSLDKWNQRTGAISVTVAAAIEQLTAERDELRGKLISVFFGSKVPEILQGAPSHEFVKLLTAKDVSAWIDKIVELRKLNSELVVALRAMVDRTDAIWKQLASEDPNSPFGRSRAVLAKVKP
jgi:hypothetical protein